MVRRKHDRVFILRISINTFVRLFSIYLSIYLRDVGELFNLLAGKLHYFGNC